METAGNLARNPLPIVHLSVVGCQFVLAGEAIPFSMMPASDHRAGELDRIVAVRGGGVTYEVMPTL